MEKFMTAYGNMFYWPFKCMQLLAERLVFILFGNQISGIFDSYFSIQQRVKQLLGKRTRNHATRSVTNAPLKCLCPLACWKHSLNSCENLWLIIVALHKGKACIVVLLFCSPMKLMTFSRRPNDKYCVVPEDGNSIFFPFFFRSFLFILSVYLRFCVSISVP